MKRLPNEILDKVFLLCSSRDINNWESYEHLSRLTFMKKKHDNLIEACKEGNITCVKFLIENGVDDVCRPISCHTPNTKKYDRDDCSLLLACGFDHIEIVKFLVKRDVHKCKDIALYKSSYRGDIQTVRFLVENGANVHAYDDVAIRWASGNGHLEVVRFLVDSGAYINSRDSSALYWAVMFDHLEVVRFLVERGADTHDSILEVALKYSNLQVVFFLSKLYVSNELTRILERRLNPIN